MRAMHCLHAALGRRGGRSPGDSLSLTLFRRNSIQPKTYSKPTRVSSAQLLNLLQVATLEMPEHSLQEVLAVGCT